MIVYNQVCFTPITPLRSAVIQVHAIATVCDRSVMPSTMHCTTLVQVRLLPPKEKQLPCKTGQQWCLSC